MEPPKPSSHRITAAARRTMLIALVLNMAGPIRAEYPSEPWSPRVAMVPTIEYPARLAVRDDWAARITPVEEPLFAEPPLDGGCASGSQPPVPADPPRHVGCVPPDAWRVQSHFMPSICRYGIVAPYPAGVESVHSPYWLGPTPWGAPVCNDGCNSTLFAPPPVEGCWEEGGWGRAAGELPIAGAGGSLGIDPSHPTHDSGRADDDSHSHELPCVDRRAMHSPYSSGDFTADPFYEHLPYDARAQADVYGGKHLNPTQRPLIEWGMPLYLGGPVPPPSEHCGVTNPSLPRFYLYGDYRAAAAYNSQNGGDQGVLANRINLEWDLWLTATERFHMSTGPFQQGNDFLGFTFDDGRGDFVDALDFFDENTDALYFEGDLGYMLGGWRGRYASFDMPVAVGLIPLLFQNGVWMEDAILGAAVTIPARNNPLLDWSNYDITFFAGVDQLTSPAFEASSAAANLVGVTTFIEAKGGYVEAGYAFLDDTAGLGRSYHNIGLSYTRRYLNLVSNSMRVIFNTGQNGDTDDRTAEGVLVIMENSFLTRWPYNVIPYVNLWAGFDDPQSVARAGAAGGVLRNTGILFESDNLTGYPTLDATANETAGAAIGIDLLAPDFSHQLILEAAALQAFGDPAFRNAPGDQYGIGARYQFPISNAHLLRFDVMHGWFESADDVTGARAEFRWKF